MKTITVKFENKGFNFNRALKELKNLQVWGVEMKFNNPNWVLKYETEEQEAKIADKMDYGWVNAAANNTKPCPRCNTYCDGDCQS